MSKAKNKNREKYNFLGNRGRNMTYKDIKRQAIILGMPFPDATGNSIGALLNFIYHTSNKPDKSLIDKYDDWMDQQLANRGYEPGVGIRNSRLRLGFLGDENEDGKRRSKRVPGLKKPKEKKPPKEKDEFGLIKGTKKSYCWSLTAKGFDLDRVTRRMHKKYPEANDKSISLWYRNCKRYLKNEGKKD